MDRGPYPSPRPRGADPPANTPPAGWPSRRAASPSGSRRPGRRRRLAPSSQASGRMALPAGRTPVRRASRREHGHPSALLWSARIEKYRTPPTLFFRRPHECAMQLPHRSFPTVLDRTSRGVTLGTPGLPATLRDVLTGHLFRQEAPVPLPRARCARNGAPSRVRNPHAPHGARRFRTSLSKLRPAAAGRSHAVPRSLLLPEKAPPGEDIPPMRGQAKYPKRGDA